ncbi:MAG: hypothetical protein IPK85_03305 [Gemmatimonadetes bacterium]|nr:hypothetical protein [Gemmatimonadota bacterium]
MAQVIRWEREPLPAWEHELGRISGPTEHLSHLVMKWVPFANQRLAQRWVVFEAVPFPYCFPVLNQMREELLLTDPLVRWAWEYAEQHNAFPVPFWVAQGHALGHPTGYNVIEQAQATVGLLPDKPPVIGELEYMEPNALMFEAIRRRSTINRKLKNAMDERAMIRDEAQRKARQTLLDQTEALLSDSVEAATREFVQSAPVMERGQANRANVDDEHLAEYVETGHLPYLKAPI